MINLAARLVEKLRVDGSLDAASLELAFEWPSGSLGWSRPEFQSFFDFLPYECVFDGCTYGVVGQDGEALQKRWRVKTNNRLLTEVLN